MFVPWAVLNIAICRPFTISLFCIQNVLYPDVVSYSTVLYMYVDFLQAVPGHWWRHLAASCGLLIYLIILSYFVSC